MEGLVNIREDEKLTDSYDSCYPIAVPCGSKLTKEIYLYVGYTMGGGENFNSVVIKVDWSTDWGTSYFWDSDFREDSDATTTGTVTTDKMEFDFGSNVAPGTYENFVFPVEVKGNMARVSFREFSHKGVLNNYGRCFAYLGYNQ